MNSRFKFPRRVRIHGGECGAVARALHHEVQEDALIPYEWAFLHQADVEKASRSTFIERKQMSTKTSIKRIALVAVAAMGFGITSVAPSSAAVQSDSLTLAATTATGTVGAASTNVITLSFLDDNAGADTITATIALLSSPTTSTALASVAETGAQDAANPAGATIVGTTQFSLASAGAGRVTASATVSLTPDVAGTYVVRITPAGGLTTTAQTWTLTAGAALAVTAADSTEILNIGAGVAAAADQTVSATRVINNAAGAQAATIVVTPLTAGGLAPVAAVALTATISGPGTLGIGTVAGVAAITPSGRAVTGGAGSYAIGVFPDGTSGVATITVSQGTTVLGTETVTFYGPLASLKATAKNTVYGADVTGAVVAGAGVADTWGVRLQGLDANGVEVPLTAASVTVTSADTNEFESATTAGVLSDDTGFTNQLLLTVDVDTTNYAGGKPTVMTYTVSTFSTTLTLTAGKNASAGGTQVVTMTTDKASYLPGEKITITVTGNDSTGKALGDGAQALFTAAPTSNIALGTLPVASPVLSGGKATYTTFAPFSAGTVVISATANNAAASAVTASFTVGGGALEDAANAAADAAAEAIDAANAATDAANLAAEAADAATVAAEEARDAADAATAAVEELATQVATLMAALKAQITTLANTVAKIAKKVKA